MDYSFHGYIDRDGVVIIASYSFNGAEWILMFSYSLLNQILMKWFIVHVFAQQS